MECTQSIRMGISMLVRLELSSHSGVKCRIQGRAVVAPCGTVQELIRLMTQVVRCGMTLKWSAAWGVFPSLVHFGSATWCMLTHDPLGYMILPLQVHPQYGSVHRTYPPQDVSTTAMTVLTVCITMPLRVAEPGLLHCTWLNGHAGCGG